MPARLLAVWAFSLLVIFGFSVAGQRPDAENAVRQAYEAGEAALRTGDLAGAQASFLKVLELVPQDVGARVNLGVVFMRQKKWPRALEYLKQAEKLAPQVTGIRLNIGLAYYREGDYAAASPAFESVLRDQADSAQARHLLGLCYLFQEHYPEAAQTLEPLWPASNSDLSYLYSLSVAAGNAGRHALEERAEARMLEVGKDSPLLHLLRGKAYLAREDFDRALDELQTATQADPKLPLLHYNLGVVYRRKGSLGKAREEFLEDIAVDPGVAYDYDQLGTLCYLQGQADDSEHYYLDALKRDPKLGTSWFGLAKIYKDEKRYPEALKALNEAGAIDPKSASVHYLRAQILGELGRKNEAQTEMATVRRLKLENLDKLEHEISGATYHDPQVAGGAATQASQ